MRSGSSPAEQFSDIASGSGKSHWSISIVAFLPQIVVNIHDCLKSSIIFCRGCTSDVSSPSGEFDVKERKVLERLSLGLDILMTADRRAVMGPRDARHLARRPICRFGIESRLEDCGGRPRACIADGSRTCRNLAVGIFSLRRNLLSSLSLP